MDKKTLTRKPSELRKLKQIINVCKASNINRIKFQDIEIEFRNGGAAGLKFESAKSDYLNKPTVDMPPDDVMLFAATPEYDAILESRKSGKIK